jgi:hypothetical protein
MSGFVEIETVDSVTPAPVDAQVTITAGHDCLAIYPGAGSIEEGVLFFYVTINNRPPLKLKAYRFTRLILRSLVEGDTIAIGSDLVRTISVCQHVQPTLGTPDWPEPQEIPTDRAEPRVWTPPAPHVQFATVRKLVLRAPEAGFREVHLREWDGETFGQPWTVLLHPTYTGDIVIPISAPGLALATHDGTPVEAYLPTYAEVTGTSHRYRLEMPPVTATTYVEAGDGTALFNAINAATSGTEVVCPPGIYTLPAKITNAEWKAGVTVRGATGDREDVELRLTPGEGLRLNPGSWSAMRGLADVKFRITSAHGNLYFGNVGIHVDNVHFEGDKTLNDDLVHCEGTGTSDRKFHDCLAHDSGADVYNTNQGDPVWLINCQGWEPGPVIQDQVVTPHNNNRIYVLGGYYAAAHTNIIARASGGRVFAEFMRYGRGARNCGIRGANLFGCSTDDHNNGQGIDESDFVLFHRTLGNNDNWLRNHDGVFESSIIDANSAAQPVFWNQTSGAATYRFNLYANCMPTSDGTNLTGYGGSKANATLAHYNHTFLECGRPFVFAGASAPMCYFRNCVSRGVGTTDIIYINNPDHSAIDGDHNTLDRANANYISNPGPGPADILGEPADITQEAIPEFAGNCDGNGTADLPTETYDWIGGRGPTFQPVIFETGVVSRGAFARPTLGELFPDAWNASSAVIADEPDFPIPDPEPEPEPYSMLDPQGILLAAIASYWETNRTAEHGLEFFSEAQFGEKTPSENPNADAARNLPYCVITAEASQLVVVTDRSQIWNHEVIFTVYGRTHAQAKTGADAILTAFLPGFAELESDPLTLARGSLVKVRPITTGFLRQDRVIYSWEIRLEFETSHAR